MAEERKSLKLGVNCNECLLQVVSVGNLMNAGKNLTKRELIIEVWEQLDCESVGAKELGEIQRFVRERLGEGAVDSPAAIARLLADEGAVLRHPEVIDCDADWRVRASAVSELPAAVNFEGLEAAAEAIKVIDDLQQELEAETRETDLMRLREAVQAIRKDRLLVARSKVVAEQVSEEAAEIAEWLRVWLTSPDIFLDWLELRQQSLDFINRFGQNRLP